MEGKIDLFYIGDIVHSAHTYIKDQINYPEKLVVIGLLLRYMENEDSGFKTVSYLIKKKRLKYSDLLMKTESEFEFIKLIKDFNANMLIRLSSEIIQGIEYDELENKCMEINEEYKKVSCENNKK
ncbi:hypothetical protein V6246_01595 [Algibacter sp. TI.3.09]|uniref:hypothetical protein n=1 Tax=Algibacter sp. TI.3.09 TaxID=3121298 RepID=UPI00311D7F1F